jgi:hypothetical protein
MKVFSKADFGIIALIWVEMRLEIRIENRKRDGGEIEIA